MTFLTDRKYYSVGVNGEHRFNKLNSQAIVLYLPKRRDEKISGNEFCVFVLLIM